MARKQDTLTQQDKRDGRMSLRHKRIRSERFDAKHEQRELRSYTSGFKVSA